MNAWVQAARPKTLPAAVVPVALGAALAQAHDTFVLWPVVICLAFALLIQVGTNFANDYYDFRSGADTDARIGPARAVASGWITPEAMRRATGVTFVLAFAVGCLLVPYGGWGLVAIGGLSILCGIAYTGGPYPLGYNGLGDVFVFIFFGLVAVTGTYYVQALEWSLASLVASIPVGLLSVAILIVNNYRDIDTDTVAGKRTLAVRLGRRLTRAQYGGSLLISY
ncbi:MAG: 1,4-dihydroxy-2-naphthoate polyprenyltransferase, partial [Opitutales bacterium]